MTSEQKAGFAPILAVLTAIFLWSGSFSATRIALGEMSPMSIMWIRMTAGFLIFLPFFGKVRPINYRKGDWKVLIPMALFQPCLYFLLESNALRFTTSSQAGVISSCVPLLVAVMAWLFLSEKLTFNIIIGLVISCVGVAVLTLGSASDENAGNPLLGNLMEMLAMVCAASNMALIKKLSSRYNTWTLTGMQVLAGSIFFLPGAFSLSNINWTTELVISMVYLGCFVTLGAFGLFNWGMGRMSATKATAFINLIPVTAVFLGWLILNEKLSPIQSAGAITVIGGVLLSQTKSRNKSDKLMTEKI